MNIVIAEAKHHDTALIYASWLEGFRRAPMHARRATAEYYAHQHPAITEMLARSKVLVARPHNWDEGVVAWAVGEQRREGFVLHAAYTKQVCRRQGLARRLVEAMDPRGPMLFSAYRPPYTRWLEPLGFKYEPRAFPALREKAAS